MLRHFTSIGLKGFNISAQGNALGVWLPIAIQALKGRHNSSSLGDVSPLQGFRTQRFLLPRALPWADVLVHLRGAKRISATSKLTLRVTMVCPIQHQAQRLLM